MRLLGKDLLKTAGDSAKTACGSKQLCAGLEAGVEAGIHAARSSWEEEGWSLDGAPDPNDPFRQYAAVVERALDQNEDWDDEALWEELPEIEAEGASLFDARNGFNELHRYHMLWQVRHRWAKGSRFAFNCYRHFNQVIVRRGNGRKAFIILSEEGLSQGDPLAMILYGVALLPLVEGLRQAVPEATTPWFADDSAAIGNMHKCAKCLEYLSEHGPTYGYYIEPEKTHVICKEEEEPEAKAAFLSRGLVVSFSRGQRYLGGFIGSKGEREKWVREKVEKWADGVRILASIARRYPQTAYAGFTMSLQQEWCYIARTCPDIGALFEPVEKEIRGSFLPALLGVEFVDADLRALVAQGVKQAGLAIRNPVDVAHQLFDSSKQATDEIVGSLRYGTELNLAEHRQKVRGANQLARNMRKMDDVAANDARAREKGIRVKNRLERAGLSGIWLTVVPNRFNGTEISMEEWRDNARLRYNLAPLAMPECCDGCGHRMSVEHALSCKVGGLVHIRHDNVAQEFGHLCGLAFKPSRVSYEPLINHNSRGTAEAAGQTWRGGTDPPANNGGANGVEGGGIPTAEDERADPTHSPYVAENENRGDIAVDGFWRTGRRCIFDVRITDTECRTTRNQEVEKVLKKCEKEKKDKYLRACHEMRRDFTPLVYSVDGCAGRETKQAEKKLAGALAGKWDREYSEMVGYVRARMALAVVRANTLLIRGSRRRRAQRPHIDEGAAMSGWRMWRDIQ
jgi:hypothetical protein